MKRASYKSAVHWIACNDDNGCVDNLEVDNVKGYISTLLVADLFGVEPEKVAKDVVKLRKSLEGKSIEEWIDESI